MKWSVCGKWCWIGNEWPADTTRASIAATGSIRLCAGTLHRRAGHVGVGTEDAAVAALRLEERAAGLAVVEILAGIGGHGFHRLMPAGGTGDGGGEDHLNLLTISEPTDSPLR